MVEGSDVDPAKEMIARKRAKLEEQQARRRELESAAAQQAAAEAATEQARAHQAELARQQAELERQREAVEFERKMLEAERVRQEKLKDPEAQLFNTLDSQGSESLTHGSSNSAGESRMECPVCAELIMVRAKACRFCGEALQEPPKRRRSSSGRQRTSSSGRHRARSSGSHRTGSGRHRASSSGRLRATPARQAPPTRKKSMAPLVAVLATGLVVGGVGLAIALTSKASPAHAELDQDPTASVQPLLAERSTQAEREAEALARQLEQEEALARQVEQEEGRRRAQEARRQEKARALAERERLAAKRLDERAYALLGDLSGVSDLNRLEELQTELRALANDAACKRRTAEEIRRGLSGARLRRELIADKCYARAFLLGSKEKHQEALALLRRTQAVTQVEPKPALLEAKQRWLSVLKRAADAQAAERLEEKKAEDAKRFAELELEVRLEALKKRARDRATEFYLLRRGERLDCGKCSGSEVVRCTSFELGEITCPTCRGERRLACRTCAGSGRERVIMFGQGDVEKTRTCSTCRGVGRATCGKCGGTGSVDCPSCEDTSISCPDCKNGVTHQSLEALMPYFTFRARRLAKGSVRKFVLSEFPLKRLPIRRVTVGTEVEIKGEFVLVKSLVTQDGYQALPEVTKWTRIKEELYLVSKVDRSFRSLVEGD